MANTKVTSGVIKDDAVGADQLASNSVVTASINDNAITTAKIADDAILTAKISNSAITNAKMSSNSVDSDQYVDGSIDTAHIGDGQVTSAKLDTNISVSGTLTVGSHLSLGDSDILKIGASSDLQLYHDGTDSNIQNATGNLYIYGGSNHIRIRPTNNQESVLAYPSGQVELYYAGAKKFETASGGVTVTGTLTADDLEIDSGTLSVDASNNRVGIGTTSPSQALDVRGGAGAGNHTHAIFTGTAGRGLALKSGQTGGQHNGKAIIDAQDTESGGASMDFQIGGNTKVAIDNSGNVGIGLTTPSNYYATSLVVSAASEKGITIAATATNIANYLMFADGTSGDARYRGYIAYNHNSDQLAFASAGTERMFIDSSGNVGIGITDPDQALEIGAGGKLKLSRADNARSMLLFTDNNNATIQSSNDPILIESANFMAFNTNGANERMRIDTSGNVMIGRTSTVGAEVFTVQASGGSSNCTFFKHATTDDRSIINTIHEGSTGSTSRFHFVTHNVSGTAVGSISANGSSTAFNTSSDSRLKNILGEAKGLEIINKLNPVNFEWKESKEIQDGLIAQEVEPIVPNAVTYNEDSDVYQLDYSKLVTPLIKAVQELSSEVEQLKAKLEDK